MHWKPWITDAGSPGSNTVFAMVALGFLIADQKFVFTQLLISYGIITLLVIATRLIHFKNRPQQEKHRGLLERIQTSSFPSGHCARISSLMIVTGNFVSNQEYWILGIVACGLVVFGRMMSDKHDFTDTFFGLVLGAAVGMGAILLLPTG